MLEHTESHKIFTQSTSPAANIDPQSKSFYKEEVANENTSGAPSLSNSAEVNQISSNFIEATSDRIIPISGFLGDRETLASPTFNHTGTKSVSISAIEKEQIADFALIKLSEEFRNDQHIMSVLAHQIQVKTQNEFCVINVPYVKTLDAYHEYGEELQLDHLSLEERNRLTLSLENLPVSGGEELFPCVAGSSLPIWERLPFEPADYFLIFTKWCDSGYEQAESGAIVKTNRSTYHLGRSLGISRGHLNYLNRVFSWNVRVKAFDMYMNSLIQQRLQRQAILARDAQFNIGQVLISKATKALDRMELTPKLALEALKLGVEYMSVSSGVLADKPDGYSTRGSLNGGNASGIQINHTNSNTNNLQINNATTDKSMVEMQMQTNLEDKGTVDQILNVLLNSGALDVALNGEVAVDNSIIDMEE